MKQAVREFVTIVNEHVDLPEPIYEFGSFLVKGQEETANLRSIFQGKKYVGCDMREGNGVDRVCDVTNTGIPSKSVGTVLILDTLEHVADPFAAMKEIYRILKPDGVVVLSVPFFFPIHDYPSDYFRYTECGVRAILKDFGQTFGRSSGPTNLPHTVVAVAVKGNGQIIDPELFDTWKSKWDKKGRWWYWKDLLKLI